MKPLLYHKEEGVPATTTFCSSFTGATANSGIQTESQELPSISMTDLRETSPIAILTPSEKEIAPLGREGLLFRWLKGSEWILYTSYQLPESVERQLNSLQGERSEEALYTIADEIAVWFADTTVPEQNLLAKSLDALSVKASRILLASLADAGIELESELLLHTIAGFLGSEDKRLAQASAICLIQCGGNLGETLLRTRLSNPESLPHDKLILGVINFMTSK